MNPLSSGMDFHANNSVIVLVDYADQVVVYGKWLQS